MLPDPPGIDELLESFPRFVTKPVPVDRASRAVLKGVATRAPRVVAPGWVKPFIPLRGFLMRLDNRMTRDPKVRKAVAAAERASK